MRNATARQLRLVAQKTGLNARGYRRLKKTWAKLPHRERHRVDAKAFFELAFNIVREGAGKAPAEPSA